MRHIRVIQTAGKYTFERFYYSNCFSCYGLLFQRCVNEEQPCLLCSTLALFWYVPCHVLAKTPIVLVFDYLMRTDTSLRSIVQAEKSYPVLDVQTVWLMALGTGYSHFRRSILRILSSMLSQLALIYRLALQYRDRTKHL